MNREDIRNIAAKHGFKLKAMNEAGEPDLHEYVYSFAEQLLSRNEGLRRKQLQRIEQLEQELKASRDYGEDLREQMRAMAKGDVR